MAAGNLETSIITVKIVFRYDDTAAEDVALIISYRTFGGWSEPIVRRLAVTLRTAIRSAGALLTRITAVQFGTGCLRAQSALGTLTGVATILGREVRTGLASFTAGTFGAGCVLP